MFQLVRPLSLDWYFRQCIPWNRNSFLRSLRRAPTPHARRRLRHLCLAAVATSSVGGMRRHRVWGTLCHHHHAHRRRTPATAKVRCSLGSLPVRYLRRKGFKALFFGCSLSGHTRKEQVTRSFLFCWMVHMSKKVGKQKKIDTRSRLFVLLSEGLPNHTSMGGLSLSGSCQKSRPKHAEADEADDAPRSCCKLNLKA